MKKILSFIILLVLSGTCLFSQTLIGKFRQGYFSGKEDYYSSIYAVATPAHKHGALMLRLHGETVIDRIYIVVDKIDVPAFINAFESCRAQYLSKERIDFNFFPPVSIMWRDRKRHIWIEAFGYLLNPDVLYDNGRAYFSLSGNAKCNFFPDQESGKYFLFLEGPSEIKGLMDVLHSDKLKFAIDHAGMTFRPFE